MIMDTNLDNAILITKKYTKFQMEEARRSDIPPNEVAKIKDKKWKVSTIDKSGFGMAIYIDIHDLIIINDNVAKIIKEYYLEEHILRNGEKKTE